MAKRIKKLKIVKLTQEELFDLDIEDGPGHYIVDPNNEDYPYVGPYDSRAEAKEDKLGLENFWKNIDEPRGEVYDDEYFSD